jgi:hypothetical protein
MGEGAILKLITMKTAIQELIEKLSMKSGDSFYALAFYHDNDKIIKEALEKEKEQMLSFGLYVKQNGWVGCKIEDMYEDYLN